MVKILASSDIHSPKYLVRFRQSLRGVGAVDLVLLAGDLMNEGSVEGFRLLEAEVCRLSSNVFAVPGNEDYDDVLPRVRSSRIKWLVDEVVRVEVGGLKLSIVGSRGSLDRPTTWQERNMPNIRDVYERRIEWISRTLRDEARLADLVILLTHYAPTYETLRGERREIWPMLGTKRLEDALMNLNVLAIHGHSHDSKVRCVRLGESTIVNVAFPNLWKPIIVEVGDGVRVHGVDCSWGRTGLLGPW